MSGLGPDPHDEIVLTAGEYVLGTLPADEADRVVREAASDPALADAILAWEHRLSPLTALVAPLDPPSTLWPRIEASAYGDGSVAMLRLRPTADTRSTRLNVWRGVAAAGFLLAASIAGVAILSRQPTTGPLLAPIAVLSPLGAKPAAFLIEAERDGAISVLPVRPDAVPAGRDLELWSLPSGATAPHPLGVLPAGGERLAAGSLPVGPAQILISLEPKGGSPTGLPTGPVLYGGAVDRAE